MPPVARARMDAGTWNVARSHLDSLGEGELQNVLRHLSARPRHVNWQHEISPRDVLSILLCGGPLAATARREILSLSMFSKSDELHALLLSKSDELRELRVDIFNHSGRVLFQHLLSELGPGLKGLFMRNYAWISPEVLRHCTLLRCLHIDSATMDMDRSELIAACKGNLRELAVAGRVLRRAMLCAIAENCTGLHKLRMEYKRTTAPSLLPVWQTVGPTLEELALDMRIVQSESGTNLVDEIAAHCSSVTAFGFKSRVSEFDLVVGLCEKLGPRLQLLRCEKIGSECPSQAQISKILDACCNLRVESDFGILQFYSLTVFRDQLRSLYMDDSFIVRRDIKEVGNSLLSLEGFL